MVPLLADHVLPKMPNSDKLLQVIFEHPTLFGVVPLVLVIRTMQNLVPFDWIPTHLSEPSEIRFMLCSLQNLVY